jgi:PAS domain S-box-containing protein
MSSAVPPPDFNFTTAISFLHGPCSDLLHAMRESIVLIDETQSIVALNPAAEGLLQCSAAQVLGQSIERFLPETARKDHARQVRAFAASSAKQRAMEHGRRVNVVRADGSVVPVEIALSRIEMIDHGRPRVLYAATMHDVSQQQALEEQLASVERRMRAIFELSPTAIWICEDDLLVYANRSAQRLFGVASVQSLLGRHVWSLLDSAVHASLRDEVERTLAGQTEGATVSGRLTRPDGQQREIEIAIAALPDHGHRTVQMVVSDVTESRRASLELERSRRGLRELSASVVEAREEERRRIARELHDELGQRLTALKIDLSNLARQAPLSDDDPRVADMQAMLDETLASVRRIASDLRPLMLDDLGLTAAIEWLAREASHRMGTPVHVRMPVTEPQVDQRVAIALYRMVQEALTNVARHAQAHTVEIELHAGERRLTLTVADDGIGLSEQALAREGSFGLLGLRERAQSLGGQLLVEARPGGGTRLVARVPTHPAPARDGTA